MATPQTTQHQLSSSTTTTTTTPTTTGQQAKGSHVTYTPRHIRYTMSYDAHTMHEKTGVSIHWTGPLDWNTGLDYWTHL